VYCLRVRHSVRALFLWLLVGRVNPEDDDAAADTYEYGSDADAAAFGGDER